MTISIIALNIVLGVGLLLIATIAFDLMHVALHTFATSRHHILRVCGQLHTTHHRFLDASLQINEQLIVANMWRHVIPEFIIQVAITLLFASVFPAMVVGIALTLELIVFVFIMWGRPGIDINHRNVDQLRPYRPMYFCVPEYHLLHHVYPHAYFSSWIKTLDHLLRTGTALSGRHVLITEGKTDFSKEFARQLKNAGAFVEVFDGAEDNHQVSRKAKLKRADIVILCHQPKTTKDYEDWIEEFYDTQQARLVPVEVWSLVSVNEFSEIELKDFAESAKKYFRAEKVIYRHLVADSWRTDPRLAKPLLKRIQRGFNYVPSCYSFAMFRHYLQFVLK